MADLPEVGARAVVENEGRFQAAMAGINRALEDVGRTAERSAARTSTLTQAQSRLSSAASAASNAIQKAALRMGPAINRVIDTLASLTMLVVKGVAAAVAAGAAAIVAGVVGLVALLKRTAGAEGIVESFQAITASLGFTTDKLLGDLRVAAAGTVRDIEMMRLANLALAGSTGEVGIALGENLPRLMEIARVQARATGESVEYMFNSLVTGVKRAQPLLIDNTGLVLKVSEATQAYADELGITVEQMTAQDRQLAVLNATLEAGQVALDLYGNASETASEKLQRIGAQVSNVMDIIGTNLQPAFRAILDVIGAVMGGIEGFVRHLGLWLQAGAQIIADALQPALEGALTWAEEINSPEAARAFALGAVNTFGSFLAGVVKAGTQILNAVADIAQGIADFLLGSSPPPKGPLHRMEEGARATMLAWLEGLVGVSLEPVAKVAAEVQEMLGPIAGWSLEQVEARLGQLDAAIAPFQNRLNVIQASLEAINAVLQPALDALDRRLTKGVQRLLAEGTEQAAAAVRAIDAQRDSLEDAMSLHQGIADAAALQLALMHSTQAEERALLAIRQAQLPAIEKVVAAQEKLKKATEKKGKGEKGGAETPRPAGTPPEIGGVDTSIAGFSFADVDVAAARAELEAAWEGAFGTAGADFGEALERVGTEGGRLKEGLEGFPARLNEAFEKAGAQFERTVARFIQPLEIAVRDAKSHFDSSQYGTFAYYIATLGPRIDSWLAGVGASFETNIAAPIRTAFSDARTSVETWVTNVQTSLTIGVAQFQRSVAQFFQPLEIAARDVGLLFDSATFGTPAYYIATFPTRVQRALATLGAWFQENVATPISDAAAPLVTFFGGVDVEGSFASKLAQFNLDFQTFLGALGGWFQENVTGPISGHVNAIRTAFETFFSTDPATEHSIGWIFNQVMTFLETVPGLVGTALQEMGGAVWDALVVPFINAANGVLSTLEDLIKSGLRSLGNFTNTTAHSLQGMGIDPGLFTQLTREIITAANEFSIPPISTARPGFIGGAASGGVFGPGLLRVGERGQELIASAQKFAVFPNNVTRALESIAGVMPGRSSMVHPSMVQNSNYNYDNRNYRNDTLVVNGVQSPSSWRREWAMTKAFR